MARTYGRLFGSMWASDDDFLELGSDAMFVYMFLVSQLDLGQSGIITLRIAPWSRLMKKTVPEVEAALKELAAERFVVIDDDEMLLLVRSLIRRDQIHQQPNVFKSAVEQVYATRSMPIRRALLAELERLPDDELKGDSKKVRADVVAWLKKACANPSPKPPGKGSPKGSPKGSDDHGRNPAPENAQIGQDFAEGADEEGCVNPSVNPSYARAHARDALPLSQPPTPTPSARQLPAPSALPLFEAAPTARDEEPPEETLNAGMLVAEWLEYRGNDRPSGRIIGQVGKNLKLLLAEIPYDVVREGFQLWENRGLDPAKLDSCVNQVQAGRRRNAPSRAVAVTVPSPQTSQEIALSSDDTVVSFQDYASRSTSRRVSATRRAVDEAEAAGEEAKRMLAAMRAAGGSSFPQIGSGA